MTFISMRTAILPFVFVFLSPLAMLSGQVKYEKEYRIKEEAVPQQALDFVASLAFDRRVKWYKEERLQGTSIEAKTCFNKHKYSIEFDSLGRLEDVEIKIKWQAIPPAVQQAILATLEEQLARHRLIKIQRQWSGPPKAVLASVQTQTQQESVVKKYEIVLKGKSEEGIQWYEYTFTAIGLEESRRRIILRNTDNLTY